MPKGESVGRGREKFSLNIKGLDDVIRFISELDSDIPDFVEGLVYKTAKEMMRPAGDISIKQTRESGGATGGGAIPVDTGLLKAVFGAVDGDANTGYFTAGNELRRQQKLKGADPSSFVIWDKIGRYQIDMGTTLYYAAIVQRKLDFTGSYLRSHEPQIEAYAQGRVNKWIDSLGKRFGFKRK